MIYGKSSFGQRVISGGHRERPGTTGGAPGVHRVGPPIPVGPLGREGKCAALWAGAPQGGPPPHAPRVKTLRGRGAPLALGGKEPPLAATPLQIGSAGGPGAPPWPLYICGGGERAAAPLPWRLSPSCHTSVSLTQGTGEALQDSPLHPPPRRRAAGSPTTSPPPCWIKKEVTLLYRTCVERGGAVRSALDHR